MDDVIIQSSEYAIVPATYEYGCHPLADEFPVVEGPEFEALVASIQTIGQTEPIVLLEDRILDGRHRYRACKRLGIPMKVRVFNDDDPDAWVRYVHAANMTRRHLSDTQRAMIAGRMVVNGKPIEQAAREMNVKARTLQKAVVIHRHGSPNVVDLVQGNKASIHIGHAVATGRLDEDVLLTARRRGRKPGDAHVNAMRNILGEGEKLYDYGDKIANNWPGDPDINVRLAKFAAFVNRLLQRTREADGAGVGDAAAVA